MFVRVKKVGPYQYLQIAHNRREGKRVKQSIVATLGRLDKLTASGAIDQLLRSAARFAERLMVLAEHSTDAHDAPDATVVSIGPALVFERLWRETGCQEVVRKLLATRHHHFDVERAVFMTVLHRLMVSGSDRSALQWRRDQAIVGAAELELQHLYRAMGWLGEELGESEPDAPSPRRTKDLIEEALFARRRDLFSDLDLVFFDTTSLFFTGDGGETLGQYGKSKDRRSDCKQMVLGMVIDGDGVPVCSEMWPGNTTDVTTLDRVAERLQRRFGVRRVCLVADAGMISKKMIAAVEARGWLYILGARLRRTKEVSDVVLNRYADLLFEVVTRRYLTSPVLITTNKPFSEWAEVFSSAACVVTLVDRLIHRSEIVQLDGESYRLREAKEQAAKRSKARSRRGAQSRASPGPRS